MDIGGGVGGWVAQAAQDAREDLWNERSYYQAGVNKQDALEESKRARQHQIDMYRNRYQMTVEDLKAAGLNPMLAVANGAGSAGGTTQASIPTVSGPKATTQNMVASMSTAAQVAAQNEVLVSQADKLRAEADEVRARTPTHAVSIDKMRQEIQQSIATIEKLAAETTHHKASAGQATQQTENLKQQIPQIQAMVKNLQATTQLTGAQWGKTLEETKEIQQRIRANLPDIQQAVQELERQARMLDMPRREQDRAAHDSFTGSMGALIRSLTGLGTYLK